MTLKKIYVSSLGRTGAAIVRKVIDSKEFEVCVGIKEEEREKHLTEFGANVTLISECETDLLAQCLSDADYMFLVPSSTETKVETGKKLIDQAVQLNVKCIVMLSLIGSESEHSSDKTHFKMFQELEEHLLSSNVMCPCILRCAYYMDNLLFYKEEIDQGHLPLPIADSKFSMIALDDVAEVFLNVIGQKCEQKVYDISEGVYSGIDICNLLNQVTGKNMVFQNVNDEESRKLLRGKDLPSYEIDSLAEFYSLAMQNIMTCSSSHFKDIVGHDPTSLIDFLKAKL